MRGDLLPRDESKARAQLAASDRAHHREPGFQSGPVGGHHRSPRKMHCMREPPTRRGSTATREPCHRGQCSADGSKTASTSRYWARRRSGARWKSPSVSLASTSRCAEPHVDLRAVGAAILERDPRANPELRLRPAFDTEQSAEAGVARHAGIAEDVHEQRVGTAGTFQLVSSSIRSARHLAAGCIGLLHAPPPRSIRDDPRVRRRQKISVPTVRSAIDHAGGCAGGNLVVEVTAALDISAPRFPAAVVSH